MAVGDGVGVAVGDGVAVGASVAVGAGVDNSVGVEVTVGVGVGVGVGPGAGAEPRDWAIGFDCTNQSVLLSFVSWMFPAEPPGKRSMLDLAGGAGAADPST